LVKKLLQTIAKVVAKPYISRELPGWGKVSKLLVGDWQRDWVWEGHPKVTIKNKVYGYETTLDISRWSDRATYFLGRWYDLQAQMLLHKVVEPGNTVVDIGANRGSFTFAAASIAGPTGHVISFEPNPTQCRIIEEEKVKNGFKNITLHNVGLADENATLDLHIPDINSGEASFTTLKYENQTAVQVPVKIGDEVLPKGLTPRLIKIDVEGFEIRVIRGLLQTISRTRPIIMTEANNDHLVRGGSSRVELLNQLVSMKYHGLSGDIQRVGGKQVLALRPTTPNDKDIVWVPNELKDAFA
jgi:FkbM family methyltransferase